MDILVKFVRHPWTLRPGRRPPPANTANRLSPPLYTNICLVVHKLFIKLHKNFIVCSLTFRILFDIIKKKTAKSETRKEQKYGYHNNNYLVIETKENVYCIPMNTTTIINYVFGKI